LSGITRVIRYQTGEINLDFTEARDSEWQRHQVGTLLQTYNHASTPPLSFFRPTNSVKTPKAWTQQLKSGEKTKK